MKRLENTGNLLVPEGTKISWDVVAYQTDSVSFLQKIIEEITFLKLSKTTLPTRRRCYK